jgi:hypothetical protein
MAGTFKSGRIEKRVPQTVAVQLTSERGAVPAELTFTENISDHGARVRSRWHWRAQEHVLFRSLPGDFHTPARITYCQRVSSVEFVVGLEFLEPAGRWILNPSNPSEDS